LTFVVDASVAAKWVLPESDSDRAVALRGNGEDMIAPSLILAEIGNALWKSAQRGEVSKSDAVRALAAAAAHLTTLVAIDELAESATALAIDLRHPIYDCFYLALAQRENAAIITADERMLAAARKARIKARLL
jgi:predicted nucleic acid-binding protein